MAILPKLKALGLRLRHWQFSVSRSILFFWVRPTFLGGNREDLQLEATDVVCYVLPFRSTADLLVTDMACEQGGLPSPVTPIERLAEQRAVFFLGRPEGTLGRKSQRQQSERMTRLFEHQTMLNASDAKDKNIKIVPVSLFWGHQPDREKSLLKLFLSENWSATSGMKKFFAGLFHPKHILVQFGKPIPLNELMASEDDRQRQIRKLLRLLRVHFNNQKQAIIGPDLSHRRTLLNTILAADGVQEAIDREVRTGNVSEGEVEKKALAYAQEIASDQSYRVIRFFDVLLTWLWNKLYNGIEVNNVEVVKQHAQSHEIVYVPCHRSHIDYLLLSYVLYHNGLTPPHIAAGRNLNLPLIGPLLRRAGAFFMRRSFQGDPLYKEVFDEYLHQMFTRGYSVEYFIEGGRSRTGRTLPPRTGMLRMTVRSFQKDAAKPIAFMPVYFGYERVLESSTYTAELSGKAKKSESVFDVFGVLPSFKRDFGQVTVNFGEPVLLRDFLDARIDGWSEPEHVTPAAFSETCQDLADTLATRINMAVAVKPTSLVAAALLSTARQNIEEQYLLNQISLLQQLAVRCGPEGSSVTDLPADEILDAAMEVIGLHRSTHRFGNIISASPEQSVDLTYNANNVAHVFVLPSLVARFIRTQHETDSTALADFVNTLFPFVSAEMFLPWQNAGLTAQTEVAVQALVSLGLIQKTGKKLTAPSTDSPEFSALSDIARISDSTLERFFVVVALLKSAGTSNPKELETASAGVAEQLSVLYGINSPDFFDRSLFSRFLTTLKEHALLDAGLGINEEFDALEATISRTLDADVQYNALQAIRHYARQRS